MKKFFLFAASFAMLAMFASCEPKDEPTPEPEKPTVKTCADNLVLHFGFEANETPGTGVALVESKGAASLDGDGYIGKGWSNTTGNNLNQAYTKYSLASASGLSGMKDVTLTAWVKLSKECSKGAILSINGMPAGFDWPLFIAYFDNTQTTEEGVEEQQVNGRLVFHDAEGNEQNLWLSTFDKAFAKYGEWFQFAFTYEAASGTWGLYVDGVNVTTAEFDPKIEFSNLLTSTSNAIYVGGWASFIEGASNAEWQSFFAGSIDEIRVFNKALSEAELQALRKEEVAIALSE